MKPAAEAVRASDAEGQAYRHGVFHPLRDAELADAPRSPDFPDPGSGPPFRRHDEVPRVPRLRHLIGPSVIALGMGLGAGELLLWPNLIVVNGYSIWWLFWVGVVTQCFVILEITRWTIATGESVFAGMARLGARGVWPWFFLVATLASGQWIRTSRSVLLTGPTGVGKTFIACALGHQAARDGFSVLYRRLPRLLDDLAIARVAGRHRPGFPRRSGRCSTRS